MSQEKYNISKLTGAQLITALCDKILLMSSVWFMAMHYEKYWLTYLLILSALPHLLFVFISSNMIRKWTPLFTMVGADYIRAILFVFASCYLYIHPQVSPSMLLLLFFLTNCAAAFFNPAMLTLPLLLADRSKLQQIMSLVSSTISISRIAGPALAIIFYRADGLMNVFVMAGISYFIAASIEVTIKLKFTGYKPEQRPKNTMCLNWREYLKRYDVIFQLLLLFFLINLFFVPLQLYIPLYSKLIFNGGFNTLSLMEIFLGAGTLLSTILLSIYHWNRSLRLKMAVSYLTMGFAYLLFAMSNTVILALIFLFLLGVASTIGNIITLNVFQSYPSTKDVPSIMACVNFTSIASAPFGLFIAGIFLNFHAIHIQVTVYALCTILLTLVILALPKLGTISKRIDYDDSTII